jgi:glycosyltransferase involved in cell wall biosynthesis
MRVAFDALVLGSGRGGDETFLSGALRGLATRAGSDDRFTLFAASDATVPADISASPAFETRRIARRPGLVHFLVSFPLAVERVQRRGASFDLCCCVTHAPLWLSVPTVLIVGDLSFLHAPEHYPIATRRRLQMLLPHQARRARAVVVPSEFSRHDVVETLHVLPEKVFVVPNVVEAPEPLSEAARQRIGRDLRAAGVGDRFVLYLGNLHPRKNVVRLVRAFGNARRRSDTLANVQLVIAGARWWGEGDEERAARGLPEGSVVMLGRVDDDTRSYLLGSAIALAYPSLFEGFGLPPIEAMAVGTPALVANSTAFPDIAGDAALAVDPLDVDAIADGLVRLVDDETLRASLRERGLERVRRYTPQRAGEAMLEALHAALA